jgi:hypothetical protein
MTMNDILEQMVILAATISILLYIKWTFYRMDKADDPSITSFWQYLTRKYY